MGLITKRKILDGAFLVEIPSIDLRLLCGCPADSIKHITRKGFASTIEKDGVKIEQGPNAILLSDIPIQGGVFANLAEFPLFHMFFTQGLIVPSHPNFGSPKPLLIGQKSQVIAQMEYVTIGNYGLTTQEAFESQGESAEFAQQYLSVKRRFALGDFHHTNELVEPVYLDDKETVLKDGLAITRMRENEFLLRFQDETIEIDLNLASKESYKPTFDLRKTEIPTCYYSITHTGEGDGWNPDKPSVSSVVQHDGKYYLVDSGPYISTILDSVGLKKSQIEGIFITHVHDDHFGGLYDFAAQSETDKKVPIFATNIVQATIKQKLAALLTRSEKDIERLYTFVELAKLTWNNVNGLAVKPIPTAHPVDTTIFLLKAKKGNTEKVYGHYCDIAALSWLKSVIVSADDNESDGITQHYYDEIKDAFNLEIDLKKIDVGGPSIHGDAQDFAEDQTAKLVLCHTHSPFTDKQLKVGEEVQFGDTDILIK